MVEIEVKLIETIAYNRRNERFDADCADCGSRTQFASPQIAGIIAGTGEREIFRLIERNAIHFIETDRVWVCVNSLPAVDHEKIVGQSA
jgi:hypothetical protein